MSQDLNLGSQVKHQSASPTVNNEEIENTRGPENLELINETVNNNPKDGLEYFVKSCSKNYNLMPALASRLSYSLAWVLCRKVFAAKELNQQFVETFYTRYLPVYLKRAYSWLTTHLLIRARTAHPEEFKKLLCALITSVEVPKEVLKDYIANVNDEKRNEFMKVICSQHLNVGQFKYHLPTLNSAFLGSEKNTLICRYIAGHLLSHSKKCFSNRDYGKLLLSFVEHCRSVPLYRNFGALTKLVEVHGTEFKGPCLAVVEDIANAVRERDNRARLNNNLRTRFKNLEENDMCSRSLL